MSGKAGQVLVGLVLAGLFASITFVTGYQLAALRRPEAVPAPPAPATEQRLPHVGRLPQAEPVAPPQARVRTLPRSQPAPPPADSPAAAPRPVTPDLPPPVMLTPQQVPTAPVVVTTPTQPTRPPQPGRRIGAPVAQQPQPPPGARPSGYGLPPLPQGTTARRRRRF